MDAGTVARSAQALGLATTDSAARWSVDGTVVSANDAKAVPADSIETVSVDHLTPGGVTRVSVVTKRGVVMAKAGINPDSGMRRAARAVKGTTDPVTAVEPVAERDQPLLMIDGVRADALVLKTLDRTRIVSVNILKGASAVQEYGDGAKNGVIVVTTRR